MTRPPKAHSSSKYRVLNSLLLALVLLLVLSAPILAYFYANIQITETDGNSYTNLPLMGDLDVDYMATNGYMTSTGLDTRVLTGDGVPLPHMLADDKVLFVSDLAAYEEKTLIFYTGAASLSSFYIIPGYGGYVTTPDDPSLEMSYVFEVLTSGYFDTSAGSDKNILYKEEALKAWISDEDTLRVATFNSSGDEQWALEYDSFDTGTHTVYVVGNGLGALLYVDNFVVAKDTENLFESNNGWLGTSSGADPRARRTFYAHDKYWAFYGSLKYKTSADGLAWSGEQSISMTGTYSYSGTFGLWYRDGYVHILSGAVDSGTGYYGVIYRRGEPQADGSIVWSADWQSVRFNVRTVAINLAAIAVTDDGRPFAVYEEKYHSAPNYKWQNHVISSSATDGTWSTDDDFETHPTSGSAPTSAWGASICSFPDSNEIYVVYRPVAGGSVYNGRYYNGASWSGSLDSFTPFNFWQSGPCVADSDGNVYVVAGGWADAPIYLWIRYADGTISDAVEVATGSAGIYSQPSIAYNEDADTVYITYIRDEYIRAVALNLNTWELSREYPLFTTAGISNQSITAEGSHIGILYTASGPPSGAYHGFLEFPWDWNDSSYNWTWMQNNVMPYADYIVMAVDGTTHLEYEPVGIIEGSNLPDTSGASGNNGTITWGTNPAGVNVTVSSLLSSGQPDTSTSTVWDDKRDVIPEVNVSDWFLEPGISTTLADNPLRWLPRLMSETTTLTELQAWRFLGLALVLFVTVGSARLVRGHYVITGIACAGAIGLLVQQTVWPLWALVFIAPAIIAGIIAERTPQV